MKKVYIVTHIDNYGFNRHNEPTRRAFLYVESVIGFLKEQIAEQMKYEKYSDEDRAKYIKIAEEDLEFDYSKSYGEYKYFTEEFSLSEFE